MLAAIGACASATPAPHVAGGGDGGSSYLNGLLRLLLPLLLLLLLLRLLLRLLRLLRLLLPHSSQLGSQLGHLPYDAG